MTGPDTRPALTETLSSPRRRERGRGPLTAFGFLLPALVLFVLLVLGPVMLSLYFSLYKWNGLGGLPQNFIGFDNFTRLWNSTLFQGDLRHLGQLILLSLLLQVPFSLAIAVLLNQKIRGRAFYRLLFFIPYILSEAITGVLFSLVMSPDIGLANNLLRTLGLPEWTWLADPSSVMISLFIVISWKYFGFHTIIYLAGLQGIPKELQEAARIDGAGSWQVFRNITLPLLGPTIRISVFLSVIGTIQLFDLVYIMTGGGPAHSSETMAVTMVDYGVRRTQVGYSSSISVVMFLISLVFALGYQRFVMRRDLEGATTTTGNLR